jgi:uncharacterized protein YodC (DUF2158 family)
MTGFQKPGLRTPRSRMWHSGGDLDGPCVQQCKWFDGCQPETNALQQDSQFKFFETTIQTPETPLNINGYTPSNMVRCHRIMKYDSSMTPQACRGRPPGLEDKYGCNSITLVTVCKLPLDLKKQCPRSGANASFVRKAQGRKAENRLV